MPKRSRISLWRCNIGCDYPDGFAGRCCLSCILGEERFVITREYSINLKAGRLRRAWVFTVVVALFAVTALAGCASGPTPEEREQMRQAAHERYLLRAQQEEERRAEEARQRKILLGLQAELKQNAPGTTPGAEDLNTVNVLLQQLNSAASESLQTDTGGFFEQSDIESNPSTLFTVDEATGRLVFSLTPDNSREVMLRQVHEVRATVITFTIALMDNPPRTSIRHEVVVDMGDNDEDLVLVKEGGEESWKHVYTVLASNAESASVIESSLQQLAAIYAK